MSTEQETSVSEQNVIKTSQFGEDTRKLIIKLMVIGGFILGMAGICTLGYLGVTRYQAYQVEQAALKKEEAHRKAQEAIRQIINFCDFAQITTEEQASIDKCGDDVGAARYAVEQIVAARALFWKNDIDDGNNKLEKVESIKRNSVYWTMDNEQTYQRVKGEILTSIQKSKEQREAWVKKMQDLKAQGLNVI